VAAMGLLGDAPEKGATRAGLVAILEACQSTVKRKSVVMCLYP
jgi:hypothetical protein